MDLRVDGAWLMEPLSQRKLFLYQFVLIVADSMQTRKKRVSETLVMEEIHDQLRCDYNLVTDLN